MTQTTLHAIDKFFTTWDKIKSGDLPETELNNLFSYLSSLDYRNEYQKKVDHYINIFAKGAIVITGIDECYRTARNSKMCNEKKDVKHYCDFFLKEHFIHVQKKFWARYKYEYKDHKNLQHYDPEPILPKEIYQACKELKKK